MRPDDELVGRNIYSCMEVYLQIYVVESFSITNYFPPFLINNIVISPSLTASNLGILFDYTLSFNPHITAITKSANYHLFRIRKIRKSITVSLTKTLVNSLVLSRIYYCSLILINLPLSSISPLNLVIRSSIRTTYNL